MRIGINGFGRIGRLFLRIALERDPSLDIMAVNTRGTPEVNAHLFEFDTTYGPYPGRVEVRGNTMWVNGRGITFLSYLNPMDIPWEDIGVDLVVESTGVFTDADVAAAHIEAGARRVLVTAPSKGADVTIVMGVNDREYDPDRHVIVSAASCTTNCLAPVVRVLLDEFGIVGGMMSTIHAYTNSQRILDKSHKDPRRSRAAAANIIPTSTGATKALRQVIPEIGGRLLGLSYRVPTLTVSVIDLTVTLERDATAAEINDAFRRAAGDRMFGILHVNERPLVSSDYRGSSYSAIVDAPITSVVPGTRMAHVVAWYDNEWGYASRVVDVARLMVNMESAVHAFSPRGHVVAAAEIRRRVLLGDMGP